MSDVMKALTEVFREVFDDPEIILTDETTADDIEGWDSLSHINLIVTIETRFDVRFKQKEAIGFKNVGELANSIRTKIS